MTERKISRISWLVLLIGLFPLSFVFFAFLYKKFGMGVINENFINTEWYPIWMVFSIIGLVFLFSFALCGIFNFK